MGEERQNTENYTSLLKCIWELQKKPSYYNAQIKFQKVFIHIATVVTEYLIIGYLVINIWEFLKQTLKIICSS
jgi:hypothetical protein